MNETPLPFFVWAMITWGFPDTARAVPSALCVVAVGFLHVPPECAPLLRKRLQGHPALDGPGVLVLVVVDDRREGISPVVRRRDRGFPHLALVALPVSQERVDAIRAVGEPPREPRPEAER